jgi:peroxiredoxin
MLPVPATYVVGQDQKVTARYVNADYTTRMEPAAVLAAVQAAAK